MDPKSKEYACVVHGECGNATATGVAAEVGWDPSTVPEPWMPAPVDEEAATAEAEAETARAVAEQKRAEAEQDKNRGAVPEAEPYVPPKALDPKSKEYACKVHGDCGTDDDGNPIWDPASVPQWDPTQGVGATPTEPAALDPLQDPSSDEFKCMVHGECGEEGGEGGKQLNQQELKQRLKESKHGPKWEAKYGEQAGYPEFLPELKAKYPDLPMGQSDHGVPGATASVRVALDRKSFCGRPACNAAWELQASNGFGSCGEQIKWVQGNVENSSSMSDACEYVAAQASTPECAPCGAEAAAAEAAERLSATIAEAQPAQQQQQQQQQQQEEQFQWSMQWEPPWCAQLPTMSDAADLAPPSATRAAPKLSLAAALGSA